MSSKPLTLLELQLLAQIKVKDARRAIASTPNNQVEQFVKPVI